MRNSPRVMESVGEKAIWGQPGDPRERVERSVDEARAAAGVDIE